MTCEKLSISCEKFVGFILDYLDGALPSETAEQFQKHLGECPACTTFLEGYRNTLEATRMLKDAECEDVPEHLVQAVMQTLRGKQ